MQFSTLVYFVLALCLASMALARPASEQGGRQSRSFGRCQPKRDSQFLEQRALCPFTTRPMKDVFDGIEVEIAELDHECKDSDRLCGEGGVGVCIPVKTPITYRGQTKNVTLAFVCAHREGGALAREVQKLSES